MASCQVFPSAPGSGTLSLQYGYRDNSGATKSGSIDLGYTATSHNNLVGTVAPSGQINATVGAGSQAVAVTFTTDDGNPVSNVAVTGSGFSQPEEVTIPGNYAFVANTANGTVTTRAVNRSIFNPVDLRAEPAVRLIDCVDVEPKLGGHHATQEFTGGEHQSSQAGGQEPAEVAHDDLQRFLSRNAARLASLW